MDSPRPQKVIACHQPVYLPFAGFFQKMAAVDEFVFMDFVQLNKRSWQVRNRIKTRAGALWLSVPVYVKGKYDQLIRDARVADDGWRRKHWEAIRHNYHAAPHFTPYADFFAEVYGRRWEWLAELNLHLIAGMRGFLGLATPIADTAGAAFAGTKSDLIVEICRTVGATAYVSSDGEETYIDEEIFRAAGIEHRYLGYRPIPYPQLFGDFIPNLAAIDLLFNCGPDAARVVRGEPPAEG